MAINDAGLVVAANALDSAITHMQAHSDDPGTGTSNVIGTRVAVNGSVDGDGDITWTNVEFTGLDPNQAVWGVTYWSADTDGTCYGKCERGEEDDATANAAGEYTFTTITETSTAS